MTRRWPKIYAGQRTAHQTRSLENRFGNQATIAVEIIEKLQANPPVRSSHPRKIIELIQAMEKALYDLNELGNADARKNPLVTKSIENKLPDRGSTVNHQNHFYKHFLQASTTKFSSETAGCIIGGLEPA